MMAPSSHPAAVNILCNRFPRGITVTRATTLPDGSHPRSREREGDSPGRQLPATQRPPRPPLPRSSRPRTSSDWGAAAGGARDDARSPAAGAKPGRRGSGGVGQGSGSLRRKRRLHQRPEGTLRRRHPALSGRGPAYSSLAPLPALGTGLLPNRRPREAPGAGRRRTYLGSGGRRADSAAQAPQPFSQTPALNNGPQPPHHFRPSRRSARPLARGGPACTAIG